MTRYAQMLPAETGGTDTPVPRAALRHGVLWRYTVLPWENLDKYRAVVDIGVAISAGACRGAHG